MTGGGGVHPFWEQRQLALSSKRQLHCTLYTSTGCAAMISLPVTLLYTILVWMNFYYISFPFCVGVLDGWVGYPSLTYRLISVYSSQTLLPKAHYFCYNRLAGKVASNTVAHSRVLYVAHYLVKQGISK